MSAALVLGAHARQIGDGLLVGLHADWERISCLVDISHDNRLCDEFELRHLPKPASDLGLLCGSGVHVIQFIP